MKIQKKVSTFYFMESTSEIIFGISFCFYIHNNLTNPEILVQNLIILMLIQSHQKIRNVADMDMSYKATQRYFSKEEDACNKDEIILNDALSIYQLIFSEWCKNLAVIGLQI